MNTESFISLLRLCEYHRVEISFFHGLQESGLIEIHVVEEVPCIHPDSIADLEKMIRMHRDLNLNAEGIDTVFNLLQRIALLEQELVTVHGQLRRYEGSE